MNKGTPIGVTIEMPEHQQINDMALAQVKGKTVAVVGGDDHELRMWDLATSGEVGKALRHGKTIYGLAVSTLNGNPVAVASYGVGMRMWDLVTGKLIGTTFGSTAVSRIASGTLDGRPIVVADHVNGGIQVCGLTTREEAGDTLRAGEVTALAITSFNGVSIAVACTESTVRAWAPGAS
jgi:WD40 repeat protein